LSGHPDCCQQGTTADRVFGVREIVSHLSQFMTLYPGDIIFTGTPAGVGDGMIPPSYLKPGDVVRIGVEHLGEQRQVIVAPAPGHCRAALTTGPPGAPGRNA
jgi:2-keto-4-pentenoate hydratase/2-oxohepta-3-ene-1,7-dioic acid hydratase in catechol pathway